MSKDQVSTSEPFANVSQAAKPTNAGIQTKNTWERVLTTERFFSSIAFLDGQFGVAASLDQVYLATEDRGKHWHENTIQIATSNRGEIYNLVKSAITYNGGIYLIGHLEDVGSAVFYSPDKGKIWEADYYDNSTLEDVFVLRDNVWLVGEINEEVEGIAPGIVLMKKFNYQDWRVIWRGRDKQPLNSIFFLTELSGWLVGPKGLIMHTNDGGLSWQQQPTTTASSLAKVVFTTPSVGYAVGSNGTILFTSNGGQTWQEQNSQTKSDLTNVAILNPSEAWIVGAGGIILYTSDNGRTWYKHRIGSQADIYVLTIASGGVWVATSDGYIFTNHQASLSK